MRYSLLPINPSMRGAPCGGGGGPQFEVRESPLSLSPSLMVRMYSSGAWCLEHIGLRPTQPSPPPSLPPLYLAIGVASQPFSVPLLPSLFPVPCSLVPSGWVAPGALCVAWVPPWIPTRGDHGSYATTTTTSNVSIYYWVHAWNHLDHNLM